VTRRTRLVLVECSVRASDRAASPRGPSGPFSRRHRTRALEIGTGPKRLNIEVSDQNYVLNQFISAAVLV
jgi:hypothetical protein